MSYDIYLKAPDDWPQGATPPDESWNYTSNCARMWRAAGADLATFDGKTAAECVPLVRNAIETIKANYPIYEAMNPPNGWGSVQSLLPALVELAEMFEKCPAALVRVFR